MAQLKSSTNSFQNLSVFNHINLIRVLFALVLIPLMLGLSSCGKSIPADKTIKVSGLEVSGDLYGFIKIIDGDYTIKYSETGKQGTMDIVLNVELIQNHPDAFDIQTIQSASNTVLELHLLDKSGVEVNTLMCNSVDKLIELLKNGTSGKQVSISFSSYPSASYKGNSPEALEKAMKETEKLELAVTKLVFSSPQSSSDISEDSEEDSSDDSANSAEFDELLNEYERYITQYIKLSKKAMQGDLTAAAEYAELLQTAERLQSKIENSSDKLTVEQANKFAKLNQKLMNAAMQ